MASEVYFVDFSQKIGNVLDSIDALWAAAGFDSVVKKDDLVAVKLHFGEYGNFRHVRPTFVAQVVRNLKRLRSKPFITDANALGGSRANAVSHLMTASSHGFTEATVGAPIVVADGLVGCDCVEVEVNGAHFKSVRVAEAAYHADCIISLAHFKGDLQRKERYWAATLKNIGVGLAAKPGKAAIHLMSPPKITSKCNNCLRCLEWCDSDAIVDAESKVKIDESKCTLCGNCVAFCPLEAVDSEWVFDQRLQERYVEYAEGVLMNKKGRMGFFNFVMDITPICDCAKWSGIPVLNDIGILASIDPVAVDKASFDLAMRQIGESNREGSWTAQLAYAEKLGLGSTNYELIQV